MILLNIRCKKILIIAAVMLGIKKLKFTLLVLIFNKFKPDPISVRPFGQVVWHARVVLVRMDGVNGRHERRQLKNKSSLQITVGARLTHRFRETRINLHSQFA